MDYLPEEQSWANDVVAKLLGTYELELHRVVESWIAAAVPLVVDVGCAEGYYAVGFARALPTARVLAFDIDGAARTRCAALATRNGVADRVTIRGACTPETLMGLPEAGVALLVDAEGYERVLLDPAAVPRLSGWDILVELHDFLDPSITRTIVSRFAATHDTELIEERPREGAGLPELAFADDGLRRLVLSERRPAQMRWAALRPRDRS
jgi:hypothetical protein